MIKLIENLKYYFERFGYRGLYVSIRSMLNKKPNLVKVKPPDFPHSVYLRTHSSDIFTYDHIFRNFEYKVTLSKKPKVILDAGANIGFSAIYFANQFTDAKIYAIEPETANLEVLKKNIRRYRNIQSVEGALWLENTMINIKHPNSDASAFQVENSSNKKKNAQQVRGITIDNFMKEFDLDFIDILKIDIEGAEKEVFEDPSLWINRIGVIIIELHDRFRPGCSETFYNAVKDFDYEFEREESIFCARKDYVIGLEKKNEWKPRDKSLVVNSAI